VKACYDQLKKQIFPDCKKFNLALMQVEAAKPTGGISEQQMINMAVAIHKKKTNRLDYLFKDTDPRGIWDNYEAWKVLRNIPKFAPTRGVRAQVEPSLGDDLDADDVEEEQPLPATSDVAIGGVATNTAPEDVAKAVNDENATNLMIGRPSRSAGRVIGKKKATLQGGKHKLTNEKDLAMQEKKDEVKKLRLELQRSSVRQENKDKIMELTMLIEICKVIDPAKADKARAKLIDLLTSRALTDSTTDDSPSLDGTESLSSDSEAFTYFSNSTAATNSTSSVPAMCTAHMARDSGVALPSSTSSVAEVTPMMANDSGVLANCSTTAFTAPDSAHVASSYSMAFPSSTSSVPEVTPMFANYSTTARTAPDSAHGGQYSSL
jgi:hypothetical protein